MQTLLAGAGRRSRRSQPRELFPTRFDYRLAVVDHLLATTSAGSFGLGIVTVSHKAHTGSQRQSSLSSQIMRLPSPATPDAPKHPLPAMTTFELRDYRRQLESAIEFFDRQDPVPPARDRLQAKLDEILAEQDQRASIAASR
jgi:hypothetical protein